MSQQERVRRYLMGELSETEQQQIEEQFFQDPEFLFEVRAIGDEMVDAYLNGDMPVRERQKFEQRVQSLPFLRSYLETSRALLHVANSSAQINTTPIQTSSRHSAKDVWRSWLNIFSPRLVTAIVVVALLIGGVWYGLQSRPTTPVSEQIIAQASAPPIASVASTATPAPSAATAQPKPIASMKPSVASRIAPVIASIVLSADVSRGETSLSRLRVPSTNGVVRLQLELPSIQRHQYQAVLQTADGNNVKSWRNLTPVRYQTTSVVELKVPAHLLPSGEYQITLSQGAASPYKFHFQVGTQ